jgi:hypothetical protein
MRDSPITTQPFEGNARDDRKPVPAGAPHDVDDFLRARG